MTIANSAQNGQAWLTELVRLANLPIAVTEAAGEAHPDGSCWLTLEDAELSPEQIQALLGDRGDVLDSIQYLLNTTLNMGRTEAQQPYTVELNGYRAQRQLELQAMATDAVEQVRASGAEFELQALSAAERRQVHTFLKDYDDVETYSRGQEPDRRLVVRPRGSESE